MVSMGGLWPGLVCTSKLLSLKFPRDLTYVHFSPYQYVNNLPNCSKHSHREMFSYDTNITVSGKTSKDLKINLNNELDKKFILTN